MSEQKQNQCDLQSLTEYIACGLPEIIPEELDQHLEVCESCRAELARRAAEPELWDEAVELLQPFSSVFQQYGSYAHTEEYSDASTDDEIADTKQSTTKLSILNWLAPTDDPDMLGRVGEYEISGVVGVGGMGSVLKGFDRSLLRVVAIKVMAPHLADSGTSRVRFEREARAAAAINHDNVVAIYRVSEANGLPYLVMPFARGPSLQKRIQEGGPLSTIEVCRVGRQIAAGLAAAHEQGLVHRDIKPANILLNDCLERILITDFGLARAMDDVSMTQTGVIAGTPQFMSPEQARGDSIDHRSDLFSLGAVLYTACTGRPPFRSEAAYGILRRITDSEPRPIQELNPDTPLWLCQLIDRLLAKHPADRFQAAEEVAELFEKCIGHLQQPAQIALPNCLLQPPTKTLPVEKTSKSKPVQKPLLKKGILLMSTIFLLLAAALGAIQITSAPDVSGPWAGETWPAIQINNVQEADNWYSGKFIDVDGNTGVLHLEWSRWDRRFNGRWTQGEDRSGSISLRQDGEQRLRGAILVDSNGNRSEAGDSLRDFVWNQSSPRESQLAFNRQARKKSEKQADNSNPFTSRNGTLQDDIVVIKTPFEGTIVKVHKQLGPGNRLAKDQALLEIAVNGSAAMTKLEKELSDLQQKLNTAEAKIDAYTKNVAAFEQAKDFSLSAAEALIEKADADLKAKQAIIVAYEAKVQQAKLNLDRQVLLRDKNLVPAKALEKMKKDLDVAKAELDAAQFEVRSLDNLRQSRIAERQEKAAEAQAKISNARAQLDKATKSKESLTNQIIAVQKQLQSSRRAIVKMPMDGEVLSLSPNCYENSFVEKGDVLVRVRKPKANWNAQGRKVANGSADRTKSNSVMVASSQGTVNRVVPGLKIGSELRKGDFLLELDTSSKEIRDEMKNRLEDLKDQANSAEQDLSTKEEKYQLLAQSKDLSEKAMKKGIVAAASRVQEKIAKLKGLEAAVSQAKLNLERQAKLADAATISQAELAKSENELSAAKSQVVAAKQEIVSLETEMQVLQTELQRDVVQMELKLNDARAEIQSSRSTLSSLEKKIRRLEIQIDSAGRMTFMMPRDGTVLKISPNCLPGGFVREGEVLIEFGNTTPKNSTPDDNPFGSTSNNSKDPFGSDSSNPGNGNDDPFGGSDPSAERDPFGSDPFEGPKPRVNRQSPGDRLPALGGITTGIGNMQISFDTLTELDNEIRSVQRKILDNQRETKKCSAKVAETQKRINVLERENASAKKSDESSLKLQEARSFLSVWKAQKTKVENATSDLNSRLNTLTSQLDTIKKLFQLKLTGAQNRLNTLGEQSKVAKLRFEQGDLTAFELMEFETKFEETKTKTAQIELLLDFCNKIGAEKE